MRADSQVAWVRLRDVQERASRKYAAQRGRWTASPTEARTASLTVPLHPPTEEQVRLDPEAAHAWTKAWQSAPTAVRVAWANRVWHRIGGQRLPVSVTLRGADAIAEIAGLGGEWRRLTVRAETMRQRFGDREALATAMRQKSKTLADLPQPEFSRLLGVLEWLMTNPTEGTYRRQLPIPGVDTKWLEGHRGLVESFATAITGRPKLGLLEAETLVRLRILDPAMRPGGLAELGATVAGLTDLSLSPEVVLVFENLESVVAMPDIAGAVVVHGSGYAVGRLADIPWIRDGRILYWGDLDSNGFAILNQLRATCPDVTSMLMDTATLDRFRTLAVVEPKPHRGQLSRLTPSEQDALVALRANGDLRLEQERIAWPYALDAILTAIVR